MSTGDDLKLPLATVRRLIVEALPEVSVSKEALTSIARAASVFVLHATNFANENRQSSKPKRETITAKDILVALGDLECDGLVEPVKKRLAEWNEAKTAQKSARAAKRPRIEDENGAIVEETTADADTADEVDEVDDVEEVENADEGEEDLPDTMPPPEEIESVQPVNDEQSNEVVQPQPVASTNENSQPDSDIVTDSQ